MAERQGMNNGTNSTASLPNSTLNSLSAPLSREANRTFRLFDICSPISHSFKSHHVAHNTAAEDRLAVTPLGGFSASKIFDLTRLRHFLPTVTKPSNFLIYVCMSREFSCTNSIDVRIDLRGFSCCNPSSIL